MTVDKAMDRIRWRFTGRKAFAPNKMDIDAFNALVEYVDAQRKGLIKGEVLFSKLYIWAYRQMLIRYKAGIFDPIPQKELHKLLEKPAVEHVREFTEHLNDSELYSIFDLTNAPDLSHIHLEHLRGILESMGFTEDVIQRRMERFEADKKEWEGRLSEYLKKNPQVEDALCKGHKPFEEKDVADNLRTMVAKALEAFAYVK